MAAIVERLQHGPSAFVLCCVLLTLYLGGAFLLVIGLAFAARTWWALVHQQSRFWAISAMTAKILVLAAGSCLVLSIPFPQRRASHHGNSWRAKRRSEMKCQARFAE